MKIILVLFLCILWSGQKVVYCGKAESDLLVDCDDETWQATFQKAKIRIQGFIEHLEDTFDAMENVNGIERIRIIFRGKHCSLKDMRQFEVDGWRCFLEKLEKTGQREYSIQDTINEALLIRLSNLRSRSAIQKNEKIKNNSDIKKELGKMTDAIYSDSYQAQNDIIVDLLSLTKLLELGDGTKKIIAASPALWSRIQGNKNYPGDLDEHIAKYQDVQLSNDYIDKSEELKVVVSISCARIIWQERFFTPFEYLPALYAEREELKKHELVERQKLEKFKKEHPQEIKELQKEHQEQQEKIFREYRKLHSPKKKGFLENQKLQRKELEGEQLVEIQECKRVQNEELQECKQLQNLLLQRIEKLEYEIKTWEKEQILPLEIPDFLKAPAQVQVTTPGSVDESEPEIGLKNLSAGEPRTNVEAQPVEVETKTSQAVAQEENKPELAELIQKPISQASEPVSPAKVAAVKKPPSPQPKAPQSEQSTSPRQPQLKGKHFQTHQTIFSANPQNVSFAEFKTLCNLLGGEILSNKGRGSHRRLQWNGKTIGGTHVPHGGNDYGPRSIRSLREALSAIGYGTINKEV